MNEKIEYQDIKHMTVAEAIEHMTHHLTTSFGEVTEVLGKMTEILDYIAKDVRDINDKML